MKFDSVKDYLIAVNYGFTTPKKLNIHREALKHGWENTKIVETIWDAMHRDYKGIPISYIYNGGETRFEYEPNLLKHPFIQEKYQKILSLRSHRGSIFEMLPPNDPDIIFSEDWFIWFFAYNNGWNSFGKLRNFAEGVFPEFKDKYIKWESEADLARKEIAKDNLYYYNFELNKQKSARRISRLEQISEEDKQYLEERNDRFLKLVYLAVYGPFKDGDDWLQGWPNYESLEEFWSNTKDLDYILGKKFHVINRSESDIRSRIREEIIPLKTFPAILPYDSSCKTAYDWILHAMELKKWPEDIIESVKGIQYQKIKK